jgi:DNA ligase-1
MDKVPLKQPMLACAEIPCLETQVKYPCFIQPKLDGIRCVAINGQAYSRKMKLIPNQFIQEVFGKLNLHGLDGELMIHGDFNKVQSAVMSEDGEPDFYYVVYDAWNLEQTYEKRRSELAIKIFSLNSEYVASIDTFIIENAEEAETELGHFIRAGYEGGILRSLNSPYKQGRSTFKEGYLVKLKKFLDDEATVIGFEERLHNTNEQERDERGYAKRSSKKDGMVGANTLGSLIVRWNDVEFGVGSGFNDTQRKEIWDNKDQYIGKLVTFRYQELSSYGVPRFPTFKWFRKEDD